MNMAKNLVLAAGLTLLGGTAAFGESARVYFNNWVDECLLTQTEGCNYYSGTLQAHAGGSAGLKFEGSTTWGGTSASAATNNQTIGSASWSSPATCPWMSRTATTTRSTSRATTAGATGRTWS